MTPQMHVSLMILCHYEKLIRKLEHCREKRKDSRGIFVCYRDHIKMCLSFIQRMQFYIHDHKQMQ